MRFRRSDEKFNDLGFGTKVTGNRMVNPDGTFNVIRRGLPSFKVIGVYHWLIAMKWIDFALLILAAYVIINVVFAAIYIIIGVKYLTGVEGTTGISKFCEAFFFSAQTFTTVGYGRLNPTGIPAGLISSLESLSGLMFFALSTGLVYGRFARPTAKILYSRIAIIAPYNGISGLEFRIANQRNNQIIELEASVTISLVKEANGVRTRQFHQLALERSKVMFFPTTWTIVHPIDEESPLYKMTEEDIHSSDAEILILLKGFDDSFSQVVYSRSSYKPNELIFGAKFLPVFSTSGSGATVVDLHRISEIEKADLPLSIEAK